MSRDTIKDLDTTLDGLGQISRCGPDRRKQIEKAMRDGPKSAPVAVADEPDMGRVRGDQRPSA